MRLLSLLILLCLFAEADAQSGRKRTEHWAGINNLFFKNASSMSTRSAGPIFTSPNLIINEELTEKELAFGFIWRTLKENNRYRQIDFLAFDQYKDRTFSALEDTITGSITPLSGRENDAIHISAGYQMGKLFPLQNWLQADIGARLIAQYQKGEPTPLTSAGFRTSLKGYGLGIDIKAGIIIKVHERLNIGYHITPINTDLIREKREVLNPILTRDQRTSTTIEFDATFFDSMLDFRNLSINYVFTTRTKRKRTSKRKRRRRR
ncbi:MAG: hypothetical protein AAFO03_16440 [Bacteroidota bacterium]